MNENKLKYIIIIDIKQIKCPLIYIINYKRKFVTGMGTLTQQPSFMHQATNVGLARPIFGGFTMKHRSPSPVRRKLFPDSTPRRSSSSQGYEETTYKPATSYSSNPISNGLPPRKFSGLISSLEESSRRSSRATSPFDETFSSYSRRSSRATSPFSTDDIRRRRRSSRASVTRSSRGSSPFEEDLPPIASKGTMQNFIDSLRSRSPSPSSGASRESPSRRRSSSAFSDKSRRVSTSPYHTVPRRRSKSPDVRAMSLTSDVSNSSTSYAKPPTPTSDGFTSPSANANGERVDKAVEFLRKLSEDWTLNTEREEEENSVDKLYDKSDYNNYFKRNSRHPFRRSSSTNSHNYNNSNNNFMSSRSVDESNNINTDNNFKSKALALASHLIEIANRRSPSPPKFLSKTKPDYSINDNAPPSQNNNFDNYTNGYKNYNDNDNSKYIDGYNNLTNTTSNGYYNSTNSGNPYISNANHNTVVTSKPPPAQHLYKSASIGPLSAPARLDEKEKYFLPFTFPEQFPYKITPGMATNGTTSPATTPTPRRFSEEGNFRRPLATLHEDEVMARRRFSEDVRKNYYDTSEVADELYQLQRRLSEAGVRKLSDANVVLTEDTDQFMIGQRVFVGGTKPGVISYIGETQFSAGDWAGVTLDEPIGKNDGSVSGVRYFQCEPRKGVFSRLTRLSRFSLNDYEDDREHDPTCARSSLSPARSITSSSVGRSSITPTRKVSPPASTKSVRSTPMGPPTGASVARKVSNPTPAAPSLSSYGNLSVSDRVVVNSKTGTRVGTLRHLGRTEFADGLWAGVELDEPTGKNDGSVAGKKYFVCKPLYGLFSPIQCVSKVGGPSSSRRTSVTPSTPGGRLSNAGLRRSNSRESLDGQSVASSVGGSSVASSVVRPSYRKPSYGGSATAARVSSSKAMQEPQEDDLDGFY